MSKTELFRGSWDIPLNSQGVLDALTVGSRTKNKWDTIYHSDLVRTTRTAKCVAKYSPQAQLISAPKLRPMHLGSLEGKPVTDSRIKEMNDYILKTPDKPLPGISSKSGEKGESLNQFKNRVLGLFKKLESKTSKDERILIVTHYRDLRLIQSWLDKGEPDDLSINLKMFTTKGPEKPADLFWFDKDDREFVKSENAYENGLFLMRHGSTSANA